MNNETCTNCPVKKVQKFHKAMEECFWRSLPPEVSQPLREARQNLLLAAKGLIEYQLNNSQAVSEAAPKSRSIKLE